MSAEENEDEKVTVDILEWVEKAKSDPQAYLERQATEVLLTTLGTVEPYAKKIFLKGGILMGVVYQSFRQTADIDFTTNLEPDPGIADRLRNALTAAFPRVAAELGYPELMCNVQSARYFPNAKLFPKADSPALKIKVGYAHRGSKQQASFERGKATNVLEVDISFREPVGAIQVVHFAGTGGKILAYSLYDLVAEKLRALLQQEVRNRFRRQDIYDIDILVERFSFDGDEKRRLLYLLFKKCAARNIIPSREALAQPEIVRRAKDQWTTLALELEELPDFDTCFVRVDDFYRSLPWEDFE